MALRSVRLGARLATRGSGVVSRRSGPSTPSRVGVTTSPSVAATARRCGAASGCLASGAFSRTRSRPCGHHFAVQLVKLFRCRDAACSCVRKMSVRCCSRRRSLTAASVFRCRRDQRALVQRMQGSRQLHPHL